VTVTFGDLVVAGAEHLDLAFTWWKNEPTGESAAAIIRGAHRITEVMSRLAADLTASAPKHSGVRPTVRLWWQAAAGAQVGLTLASAALEESTKQFGRLGSQASGVPASHVNLAAAQLAAARDLLQTHRAVEPHRDLAPSDWSAVMNSPEVTGALLMGMGEWAQSLAAWLSQEQLTDLPLPTRSRNLNRKQSLQACRGLWAAVATIEMASRQHPIPPTARDLLNGIPSAVLPARRLPDGEETIDELCRQARISAQRVRAEARRAAAEAHWSPDTTADTWQWTAGACVILSHMTGLLLGNTGVQEALTCAYPVSTARSRAAADAASAACHGWRQAAAAWDTVTTETRGLTAPVINDMSDLLLRIGRITFANSGWTPARAERAPLRRPEELATTATGLVSVVTAAHETADALACVAAADRQAVKLADCAWRLHVPTRCLPDDYDIPYPFGAPAREQVGAILIAYDTAVTASTEAAATLGEVALRIDAPSAPLATARKLASLADASPETHREYDGTELRRAARRMGESQITGPVERKLIKLGVTDARTLLQAAAIDHAGRNLITSAKNARSHPVLRPEPANSPRTSAHAQPPPSVRPTRQVGTTPAGPTIGR
jgi:hypothetical protein